MQALDKQIFNSIDDNGNEFEMIAAQEYVEISNRALGFAPSSHYIFIAT